MYVSESVVAFSLPDNFSTNPTSGLSMKTYLYRASNLKSTITFLGLSFIMVEVKFLATAKNLHFLQFIYNHYHQLLQMGFLRVY